MAQAPDTVKSYLAYDQYVLAPFDGNHIIHSDNGVPLNQFKVKNPMVMMVDRFSRGGDGEILLMGETSATFKCYVAAEIGKKIVRSLLKRLREIESEGGFILDLTEENILVYPTTGKIKLKDVEIIKHQSAVVREHNLRLNYAQVAFIIEELFVLSDQTALPRDLIHLVDMLRTSFEDREIFCIHTSLSSLTCHPYLFKEMHDLLEYSVTDLEYHATCDAIAAHLGSDWRSDVRSNSLLRYTFNFHGNASSYAIPATSSNQTSLTLDQIDALTKVNLPFGVNQTTLTRFQRRVIDINKLLTFLRNRFSHRMEAGHAILNSQSNQFTAAVSELTTRVKFDIVLAVIQRCLHMIGKLAVLNLRDLF